MHNGIFCDARFYKLLSVKIRRTNVEVDFIVHLHSLVVLSLNNSKVGLKCGVFYAFLLKCRLVAVLSHAAVAHLVAAKHSVCRAHAVEVVRRKHNRNIILLYCVQNRKRNVSVNQIYMHNIGLFCLNKLFDFLFSIKRIQGVHTFCEFLKRRHTLVEINIF